VGGEIFRTRSGRP